MFRRIHRKMLDDNTNAQEIHRTMLENETNVQEETRRMLRRRCTVMSEEDDGSTCKNEAVVPPRWSHGGSRKPQKIVFQRLQRRPHFSQPTSQLLDRQTTSIERG